MGLCKKPAYDAQGAILLEREAKGLKQPVRTYSYSVDGEKMLNFASMIGEIVDDIRSGVPNRIIAQRFHSTIVHSGIEMCRIIRKSTGIDMVALSGGVFQNRIILRSFVSLLKKNNFSVLINSLVPPNDGGISLGQGLVALKSMEGGHP
jgi:hydrogenase maturation protein HypF